MVPTRVTAAAPIKRLRRMRLSFRRISGLVEWRLKVGPLRGGCDDDVFIETSSINSFLGVACPFAT